MNFQPEVVLDFIDRQERIMGGLWANHRLPASRMSLLNNAEPYGDEYRRGYRDAEQLRIAATPMGSNLRERGYVHGYLDGLQALREQAEEEQELGDSWAENWNYGWSDADC